MHFPPGVEVKVFMCVIFEYIFQHYKSYSCLFYIIFCPYKFRLVVLGIQFPAYMTPNYWISEVVVSGH